MHQVSVFQFAGRTIIAPYTLVPWFAVMALGFCCGPLVETRRGAPTDFARRGFCGKHRLRHRQGPERLWRSCTMVGAAIRNLYGTVFPEHHQVSAVVVVSVDDAWSGTSRARLL